MLIEHNLKSIEKIAKYGEGMLLKVKIEK